MHPGWSAEVSYPYFRQLLNTTRSHFTTHLLSHAPDALQQSDSPALFLRHDIKVSLKRALPVAEIEYEYGLPATYMVRVDSPLYSLNERQARSQLLELLQMGHEVGLHFDLVNDERQNQSYRSLVESQLRPACYRLEQIICRPVRVLSLYRPIPRLFGGPLFVDGRINADAHVLRQWVLTNTRGSWHNGDPLRHLAQPAGPALQLILQPIWWGYQDMPAPQRLQEFFESVTYDSSAREASIFDINLAKAIPDVRRQGIYELVSGGSSR